MPHELRVRCSPLPCWQLNRALLKCFSTLRKGVDRSCRAGGPEVERSAVCSGTLALADCVATDRTQHTRKNGDLWPGGNFKDAKMSRSWAISVRRVWCTGMPCREKQNAVLDNSA